MLRILLAMPIIQLLLLAHAANFEVKNLKIHIINQDFSPASYQLINKIQGSTYFEVTSASLDMPTGYEAVEKEQADVILKIPVHFEKHLYKNNRAELQLLINAINGTKAGLANAYLNAIVREFNQQLRSAWIGTSSSIPQAAIVVANRNWFNPLLDYKYNMVPGILMVLVTMIAVFLTALNIVREKEMGTIEQLNVTTVKKYQFILSKLIPFWVLALVDVAIGFILAVAWFQIPVAGSFLLMFSFINMYLVAVLGLGMLISTISQTQQQAMYVSFFILIIFILMSGLFTPVENMPAWAQWLTKVNPIAYAVKFMRMVMLKGSGWQDVISLLVIIGIYAIISNILAVWNYRKTTG
jgi:ABC-2 type transport system permease protein